MRIVLAAAFAVAMGVSACAPDSAQPPPGVTAPAAGAELVPTDREAKAALGLQHATAVDLYAALKARANGGAPLSPDDMPDWTGL